MNSIRTQTTGKSTIHRNVPRRSRSQEPMQRRKSDKNNHDLSIKLNQIATKKLLICAAIIAFLAPNCRAAEIDLLAKPNDWVLDGTSEGIYSIDKDRIRAKRRSNESATVLTDYDVENFILRFDFKLLRDCELIFLIHAPRNGAYAAGLELVLSDHQGKPVTDVSAGALYKHVPARVDAIKKENQWNLCEVVVNWPQLKVTLNGQVVQDIDLSGHPELKHKLRRGAIGFRDLLGWGFEVRNLKFQELSDSEGGITMFNGKNLRGWKEVRKSNATWKAKDGVIVGDNGNGYLQYKEVCQDFDLRLYYRTTPTANGGVFFRWKSDDSERGNEIQILDVLETYSPSGSIYNIVRTEDSRVESGEWHLMQVSVLGNHAITHINGIKTAETNDLVNIWPGHITLQMHKEKSTIEFKDLVLVNRDR